MISPKHILLICQLWAAVGAYPAWKDLQPGNKYKGTTANKPEVKKYLLFKIVLWPSSDFTFLGKGPSSTPLLNNNFNESVYFTAAGHVSQVKYIWGELNRLLLFICFFSISAEMD